MKKQKLSALISIIGALLFGIATAFHPLLTNPWDVGFAFKEVATHHHWILDHWLFLLGLFVWLLGLIFFMKYSPMQVNRIPASLFITSLGLWCLIVSAEIAVLPQHLNKIIHGQTSLYPLWGALFTWGLFAGYLAMILVYVGILIWACSYHGYVKLVGIGASLLGCLGALLSLWFPSWSLYIQFLTAPLPYLWTLWMTGRTFFSH
ncbi:hypothetical protein GMB86_02735 [Terrilactibacillus sp. BCM23-1]|uniref:DUF998 domain-containing protein n=1 Tax=Terrilactibacillus tamarindi TaxID=2599694 RepID=A0A6N8CN02_9BACI|nr:hypothetical protein [Terrilactibacillus tamarindi]MTT30930.1 hypothetical protein [Terrilactibacillus tamarindi]